MEMDIWGSILEMPSATTFSALLTISRVWYDVLVYFCTCLSIALFRVYIMETDISALSLKLTWNRITPPPQMEDSDDDEPKVSADVNMAAAEAAVPIGHGGATGLAATAAQRGAMELAADENLQVVSGYQRSGGGGFF